MSTANPNPAPSDAQYAIVSPGGDHRLPNCREILFDSTDFTVTDIPNEKRTTISLTGGGGGGGSVNPPVIMTSDYTAQANDSIIYMDADAIELTLPSPV